jgi:hypothetical protein
MSISRLIFMTQPRNVRIRQVANPERRAHTSRGHDPPCRGAPNAEDVRQPYLDLLVTRQVDSGYACHLLALTLLVLGIALADDAHHPVAFDDFAVLTNWLDAAANFHVLTPRPGNRACGQRPGPDSRGNGVSGQAVKRIDTWGAMQGAEGASHVSEISAAQ